MKNMKGLEKNDIRLALFFLDILMEKMRPFFNGKLFLKHTYRVYIGSSISDDVMAIMERVPNPNFGKPPCHFEKPVVMISKEPQDDNLVLNWSKSIAGNRELRKILEDQKKEFESNDGLCLACFMFYARDVPR
jgi:hypothetical protein